MCSSCLKKKKARGKHRWAWKEDANNSSGSRDIKCYSWLKGKPQDDGGPCSFPLASASPEPRGRPPRVRTSPSELWKTITYLNQGYTRGLITDVEMPSISFLSHSFKWAGTRKEAILTLTQWASFITLAVLHYSPIIFYFNSIIREVLIWLFCNSENEYQCNIKLLL